MLAMIFYTLTCFSTSYRIASFASYEQPSTPRQWNVAYLNFATWRVAQGLTYIIFIQRLKQTFKNTQYASYPCTYNTLYILSIIFVLLEPIADIIYAVLKINLITDDFIIFIEFILSSIIDLILSFTLLWLFLTKLSALNINISYLHQQFGHNDENNKIYKSQSHERILMNKYMKINHVSAKITLLTSFSLLSTQLLMVLFALEFFMHNRTNNNNKNSTVKLLSYYWIIFWAIDSCINCICIFWSFDFAVKWYFCFCGKCHKCAVKCCTKRSKGLVDDLLNYHKLNNGESVNETYTRSIMLGADQ